MREITYVRFGSKIADPHPVPKRLLSVHLGS
jgi:hypothetical protein